MKKFLSIILVVIISLLSLFIVGCDEGKTYPISDYILTLDYKEDFKILQLSDIHIANKDDRVRQYKFLDGIIKEANADMIIVSGDLFTFADKTTANELLDFLDSYNTPWTVTFGNHDEQCYFSIDYLTDKLNNYGSNCYFRDLNNDDVYGYANHVINLMDGGKVKEQIIILDSNRYYYGDYIGYDWIREDQIEWYKRVVDYTTEQEGKIVDSIMFYHIPQPEYQEAWDNAQAGDSDAILEYGTLNESISCPEYNSGLFDVVLQKGSTKCICVGHDHENNFRIKYKGVYLCYGINSSDRIYFKEDLLGGHTITIKSDNTLTFDHILRSYDDYE